MTDKNGGPAFPFPSDDGPGQFPPSRGMTLRDWFAGQALAGIIASTANPNSSGPADFAPGLLGKAAYEAADALLAAREGGAK